jgi:cysteine desulfurase
VAHLTGNFTSEAPLSPAVREAIGAALEQGWADPKKLSTDAGRAANLANAAKEEIADYLHTSPANLEILGEPSLAHFIAIAGFLKADTKFFTSTVDVGKIRAIARAHSGEVVEVGVDFKGELLRDGLRLSAHSLLSLQAANGETGISQDLDHWRESPGRVIVDATRALPVQDYVTGFSATTFDATSFGGPAGIGFIAITDGANFRYPLPHIAPIRVPGSFSLPLLIGSAVAIGESVANSHELISLRNFAADELRSIAGITVLGEKSEPASRHLSIVIEEVSSEELLRALLPLDFVVDAGSACSPEDLTPSHVVASMGYPTPGHIRITIHEGQSQEKIKDLVATLKVTLQQLRS